MVRRSFNDSPRRTEACGPHPEATLRREKTSSAGLDRTTKLAPIGARAGAPDAAPLTRVSARAGPLAAGGLRGCAGSGEAKEYVMAVGRAAAERTRAPGSRAPR